MVAALLTTTVHSLFIAIQSLVRRMVALSKPWKVQAPKPDRISLDRAFFIHTKGRSSERPPYSLQSTNYNLLY